jgi:predicted nucleic acid-binding protein
MSGDFLDSNVLLCLFSDEDAAKREVATSVVEAALTEGGSISFQVVHEVLNSMVRRAIPLATPDDTRRFLHGTLARLWRVMPSEDLYHRALELHGRYGYGFYDSLIIAATLEAGCARLLSEDLQPGQRIEGLTIVNPFAA